MASSSSNINSTMDIFQGEKLEEACKNAYNRLDKISRCDSVYDLINNRSLNRQSLKMYDPTTGNVHREFVERIIKIVKSIRMQASQNSKNPLDSYSFSILPNKNATGKELLTKFRDTSGIYLTLKAYPELQRELAIESRLCHSMQFDHQVDAFCGFVKKIIPIVENLYYQLPLQTKEGRLPFVFGALQSLEKFRKDFKDFGFMPTNLKEGQDGRKELSGVNDSWKELKTKIAGDLDALFINFCTLYSYGFSIRDKEKFVTNQEYELIRKIGEMRSLLKQYFLEGDYENSFACINSINETIEVVSKKINLANDLLNDEKNNCKALLDAYKGSPEQKLQLKTMFTKAKEIRDFQNLHIVLFFMSRIQNFIRDYCLLDSNSVAKEKLTKIANDILENKNLNFYEEDCKISTILNDMRTLFTKLEDFIKVILPMVSAKTINSLQKTINKKIDLNRYSLAPVVNDSLNREFILRGFERLNKATDLGIDLIIFKDETESFPVHDIYELLNDSKLVAKLMNADKEVLQTYMHQKLQFDQTEIDDLEAFLQFLLDLEPSLYDLVKEDSSLYTAYRLTSLKTYYVRQLTKLNSFEVYSFEVLKLKRLFKSWDGLAKAKEETEVIKSWKNQTLDELRSRKRDVMEVLALLSQDISNDLTRLGPDKMDKTLQEITHDLSHNQYKNLVKKKTSTFTKHHRP